MANEDLLSSKLAYEPPDSQRPASGVSTEPVLESEAVGTLPVHDPYAALRIPAFRRYASGWMLSVVGQQLQGVAVGWEIYQRTGKAISLGWVGLVQAIPVVALALPAGQLVDLIDRKKIIAVTQFLSAACSVGLALLSWHQGSIAALYGVLFAGATFYAISGPARAAFLPQIVPTEKFSNAVAWNSSLFQIASVAGPAIGGLIVAVKVWPAYALDALCAAAFGVLVTLMPALPQTVRRDPPTLRGLVAGIRFVWRTKIILATITMDLFAVLLGGAVYLLPVYAKILNVGSFGFGCLRAAPAFGAVAMALYLAHRRPMRHAGQAMLWAVAGFGVATIIFGISRNYWLSLAMLLLTGAFDNISVVVRHTLVQVLTPDEMRGRVSAVNNVFIGASNELGGFESGVTADAMGKLTARVPSLRDMADRAGLTVASFGTMVSVVCGGIGTIVVVGLVGLLWPQVRRFGSLQDAAAESPALDKPAATV